MTDILSDIHTHDIITIGRVNGIELVTHLVLGTESLDDTETAESLVHHTHRIAP